MEIVQLSATGWTSWLCLVRGSRLSPSATTLLVGRNHAAWMETIWPSLQHHQMSPFWRMTIQENVCLRTSADQLMQSTPWSPRSSCRWSHDSPPVITLIVDLTCLHQADCRMSTGRDKNFCWQIGFRLSRNVQCTVYYHFIFKLVSVYLQIRVIDFVKLKGLLT